MGFYDELNSKMKETADKASEENTKGGEEKETGEGVTPDAANEKQKAEDSKSPSGGEKGGEEKAEGVQGTDLSAIKDEDVLNVLKDRYKVSAESLDEILNPKVDAPEDPFANETIKSINDFVKETNRDPMDYFKAQQDWDKKAKDSPNEVVEMYLEQQYPELSKDDLKYELEDYLPLEELDPDEHDASEVNKRKRENKKRDNEFKKLLHKSKEYFNEQKEKYKSPVKSEADKMKANLVADSEEFGQNMNKVLEEKINELKFTTDEGEFTYSIENKDKLKSNMSSLDNVINMFRDDKGTFNYEQFATTLISGMNAKDIAKSISQNAAAKAKEDVLNEMTPGRQGSPGSKEGGNQQSETQKSTVDNINKVMNKGRTKRKIG